MPATINHQLSIQLLSKLESNRHQVAHASQGTRKWTPFEDIKEKKRSKHLCVCVEKFECFHLAYRCSIISFHLLNVVYFGNRYLG